MVKRLTPDKLRVGDKINGHEEGWLTVLSIDRGGSKYKPVLYVEVETAEGIKTLDCVKHPWGWSDEFEVVRLRESATNNIKCKKGYGTMVRRLHERQGIDGNVTLKGMNTEVMPVVDFGCYWGALKYIFEDVFVYDFIELDNLDPADESYEEIVSLVDEEYDGRDEFYQQVLDYAQPTIQQAFDEYGIKISVVPGSCKWYHQRQYNYGDDEMQFDATVDTAWVENTFRSLSNDPAFIKFVRDNFSSRDGFISFMPNDIDSYSEILNPSDGDYWKLVSAIVQYLVNEDPSIREDVTEDLVEDLRGNANFVTCSELGIY